MIKTFASSAFYIEYQFSSELSYSGKSHCNLHYNIVECKERNGAINMKAVYWLVLFIILVIIEIFTLGLTTIWFAIGALCSFVAALIGFGLPVQMGIFIVVSVMSLIITRPIAMKYFNKEREKTNAESLIGLTALVLEDIDEVHGTGRVVVNGQEWSAKLDSTEECLKKDDIVSIMGIQGVKLIVEKKER
ncbi:MAG: NfeD family protein [Lachnospiraceae bacterium]